MINRIIVVILIIYAAMSSNCYSQEDEYSQQYDLAIKGQVKAQAFVGKQLYQEYMQTKDPQKIAESSEWLRKAATQDDNSSQVLLGIIYYQTDLNLINSAVNYKEAVYWLSKAIEKGDKRHAALIGDMYRKGGHGIDANQAEAVRLYTIAARDGLDEAQYNLAMYYINGDVVAKDLKMAFYLLDKAANQGLLRAQSQIIKFYVDLNDFEKACKWSDIANNNYKFDSTNLDDVSVKATMLQVAKTCIEMQEAEGK